MSHSYEHVRLVNEERGEKFSSKAVYGRSGRFPTVWYIFCHILSSFVVIAALAVVIGCSFSMAYSFNWRSTMAAVSACFLILLSIPAGVCAPIAVFYANHKSVVAWTIVHSLLFTFILLFTILYYVAARLGYLIGIYAITMSAVQLIFCCVYGPLISIRNLQRHPVCCSSDH